MCFGAPKIAAPPPPAVPIKQPVARKVGEDVLAARNNRQRDRARALGFAGTRRSGPQGLFAPASSQGKSLLGG